MSGGQAASKGQCSRWTKGGHAAAAASWRPSDRQVEQPTSGAANQCWLPALPSARQLAHAKLSQPQLEQHSPPAREAEVALLAASSSRRRMATPLTCMASY